MATGGSAAGVSDLSEPENRFEDSATELLEVYVPVRTPNGTTMLFEAYFLYDGVTEMGRRTSLRFAPVAPRRPDGRHAAVPLCDPGRGSHGDGAGGTGPCAAMVDPAALEAMPGTRWADLPASSTIGIAAATDRAIATLRGVASLAGTPAFLGCPPDVAAATPRVSTPALGLPTSIP